MTLGVPMQARQGDVGRCEVTVHCAGSAFSSIALQGCLPAEIIELLPSRTRIQLKVRYACCTELPSTSHDQTQRSGPFYLTEPEASLSSWTHFSRYKETKPNGAQLSQFSV